MTSSHGAIAKLYLSRDIRGHKTNIRQTLDALFYAIGYFCLPSNPGQTDIKKCRVLISVKLQYLQCAVLLFGGKRYFYFNAPVKLPALRGIISRYRVILSQSAYLEVNRVESAVPEQQLQEVGSTRYADMPV